MSVSGVLSSFLSGSNEALIQTSRADAFGLDIYGRSAIEAARVHFDFQISGIRRSPTFELIFGHLDKAPMALAADIVSDHIIRLWRLGPRISGDRLLGLDVPRYNATQVAFDFDLRQEHPAFAFDPTEFPGLSPNDASITFNLRSEISKVAESLWPDLPVIRPRLQVLRAASDSNGPFGLITVLGETDGPIRHPVAGFAAWLLRDGEFVFFPDQANNLAFS
jgi:hypothetical protein